MAKFVSPSVQALRDLRFQVKNLSARVKELKVVVQAEKQAAAEAKRTAAIARAEARLQKLLDKQIGKVGAKAAKANRKAGAVTVTKA
jgi:hypothetical protein